MSLGHYPVSHHIWIIHLQYPIIHYVNATHLCANPANETTFTFKKHTRLVLLQNKIPSFSSCILIHLIFLQEKKKSTNIPKSGVFI